MQPFPFRGPLTAEWPLPSGTPWREAELYDHDQLRHQHGSTISRHPEPAGVNIMAAQSSSTTTSICSTNLKTFGIDSFVKLDIWSQVKIDNSFHGVRRQLRQPVLQDVILQPERTKFVRTKLMSRRAIGASGSGLPGQEAINEHNRSSGGGRVDRAEHGGTQEQRRRGTGHRARSSQDRD